MRLAQLRVLLSWLLFAVAIVVAFSFHSQYGVLVCGLASLVRIPWFVSSGLPVWTRQSTVATLFLFSAAVLLSVFALFLPPGWQADLRPVLDWGFGVPLILIVVAAEWRVFHLAGVRTA